MAEIPGTLIKLAKQQRIEMHTLRTGVLKIQIQSAEYVQQRRERLYPNKYHPLQ